MNRVACLPNKGLLLSRSRSIVTLFNNNNNNNNNNNTSIRCLSTSNHNNSEKRFPCETYYNRNPVNLMFTRQVPKGERAYYEVFFHEEIDETLLIANVKDHRGDIIFELNSKVSFS